MTERLQKNADNVQCLSWEEVKTHVQSGALEKLVRSPLETARYQTFKRRLEANGSNIMKHVLENKLRWTEQELNVINEQWYCTDRQKIDHILRDHTTFCVLENEFPYNVEKDVLHVVIWSKIKIPTLAMNDDERHVVEGFVRCVADAVGVKEHVWFINYPHLQSIRSVSHIHVLLRTKDKAEVLQMICEEEVLTKAMKCIDGR